MHASPFMTDVTFLTFYRPLRRSQWTGHRLKMGALIIPMQMDLWIHRDP